MMSLWGIFYILFCCYLCSLGKGEKFRYSTTLMSGVGCGKTLLVSSAGLMQYALPGVGYEPGDCEVVLRAQDSFKSVSVIITDVDMDVGQRGDCSRDRLEVFSGYSSQHINTTLLTKYGICTLLIPPDKKSLGFISKKDHLVLKMTSHAGSEHRMGFRLVFTSITRGGCDENEWMCCDQEGCINKRHRSDGQPNCVDQSDERRMRTCVSKVAAGVISSSVFLVVGILVVVGFWLWRQRAMRRGDKVKIAGSKMSFSSAPEPLSTEPGGRRQPPRQEAAKRSPRSSPANGAPERAAPTQRPLLQEGDDSVFEEDGPPPYTSPRTSQQPRTEDTAVFTNHYAPEGGEPLNKPQPAPRRSLKSLSEVTAEVVTPRQAEATPRSTLPAPILSLHSTPQQSQSSLARRNDSLNTSRLSQPVGTPLQSQVSLATNRSPAQSAASLTPSRGHVQLTPAGTPTPRQTSTPRGISAPSATPVRREESPKPKKLKSLDDRVEAVVSAKKSKAPPRQTAGPPEDRKKAKGGPPESKRGPPEDSRSRRANTSTSRR